MKLEDLINNPPLWINGKGNFGEIVLSSRVRIARNLTSFPFPERAKNNELDEILSITKRALQITRGLKDGLFLKIGELSAIDKEFLRERYLITKNLEEKPQHRGIMIGHGEYLSIMINEEDHLRIQALAPGLNLEEAWTIAEKLERNLENKLDFAFSEKFGYLTACLTNVGTGIRASLLVHLPGLVHAKEIRKTLSNLADIGASVRGLYGEGSKVEGNFFQISNQITLGKREENIIQELHNEAVKIIEREKLARNVLIKNARAQIEDKIWRSYGILKNARVLSSHEFINLSSAVRFGVGLGVLPSSVDLEVLNKLLIITKPAHLQKMLGKSLGPGERDMRRASHVRNQLG